MTSNPPAVSIVMPVFNAGEHVAAAVSKIFRQTFSDFELIVIDDGSSDRTAAVAADLALSYERMRVIALAENAGVARARNRALEGAVGAYVWFVDHDDDWSDEFLAQMYARATAADADVVMCGATHVTTFGERQGRELEAALSWQSTTSETYASGLLDGSIKGYLWNKLFRRALLLPDHFPPMTSQSDFAGQAILASRVKSAVRIDQTLYFHVVRPGSITNSTPKLHNLATCIQIVEALAECCPHPPSPRQLRLFELWYAHAAIANTFLRLRAVDQGSRSLLAWSRRDITASDLRLAATRSPSFAMQLAAIRLAWPVYVLAYRTRIGMRNAVRRLRAVARRRARPGGS